MRGRNHEDVRRVLLVSEEPFVLSQRLRLVNHLSRDRSRSAAHQGPGNRLPMLDLAVMQEELRGQVTGKRLGNVAWELSSDRDTHAERPTLARELLQALAVFHAPGFVKNQ